MGAVRDGMVWCTAEWRRTGARIYSISFISPLCSRRIPTIKQCKGSKPNQKIHHPSVLHHYLTLSPLSRFLLLRILSILSLAVLSILSLAVLSLNVVVPSPESATLSSSDTHTLDNHTNLPKMPRLCAGTPGAPTSSASNYDL